MKRLLLTIVAVATLASCATTDTEFFVKDGVCYRTRTVKTAGIQTDKKTVQAVPENCGITTTSAAG